MLDGGLVLGPVIGTYYTLLQKEISKIPTFTPSLFDQTRRITRHNVSVTRYKSVVKKGHDCSPASIILNEMVNTQSTDKGPFFSFCALQHSTLKTFIRQSLI